jgi:ATP-dependent Clp protease ATP-binding subunit ClpB
MMELVSPVLYCAIARNDRDLVDLLLEYGVNPNGRTDTNINAPPIAFAVIHGHIDSFDTTEILESLLCAGVDPKTIPEDMWKNYMEMPRETWPTKDHKGLTWCDDDTRKQIAQGLNLGQRYALFRASLCPALTTRELQSAELYGVKNLIRLPHRVVGQIPAVEPLQKYILEHFASSVDDPEPLVMVFAGPPGHGKTELAQQLGDLLGVKQDTVACSQMNCEFELFGAKLGYDRSQEGSKLNNLLAQNDGLSSVAFLDEFDKTSSKVCEALLTVMSEGM